MSFMESIRACFSKYVTFSGRAQRSEFWWFALFTMVANWVLSVVDGILFGQVTTTSGNGSYGFQTESVPVLSGIFGLVVLLPSISVAVRRLHDTNRSGWWWWLMLIPLVGWIILIVWYATKGTDGGNDYGPDPLGGGGGGGAPEEGYAASSIPNVSND